MHGGIIASVLLACLICQVASQCDLAAEERAPHDVRAAINESVCDNAIGEKSVRAFISWEPPRVVTTPIEAYVLHIVTVQGIDIAVRVAPNVTQHYVDYMHCWSVYILRVEAIYECGESAFSRAVLYGTGNPEHRFLPQDLSADEDYTSCATGDKYASFSLRWKPANLGDMNVTGYTVTVYADNGTTKVFRLPESARGFKFPHVNCTGTKIVGVSARTLVPLGLLDYSKGEINFPAAYVALSAETKPYIVPVEKVASSTTIEPSTTKPSIATTQRASPTTTEPSATKLSTTTTQHSSTTPLGSTEHSAMTTAHHYSSTIYNDVEPVSSGVSTSTILCAVLIPLAIIILAGLLFFGYKKFKESGREGLLSASDSP